MRIVLLGEQATGKSSMLVALYGALIHRRAGAMRILRTDDDVEFLSRGLEALARLESVRRTEADSDARVALAVSHGAGTVAIEMPDRSGDQLRTMIDTRLWDPQLQRHVATADGAMLFLRASWPSDDAVSAEHWDPFGEPLRIDGDDAPQDGGEEWHSAERGPGEDPFVLPWHREEDRMSPVSIDAPSGADDESATADPFARPWDEAGTEPQGQAGDQTGEDAQSAGAPADSVSEPENWAPSRMPVDVRAVDLLQELVEERSTRLPLAVIVSAWDRTVGAATPTNWLAKQLPLLEQFLACNSGQLPHAVFGVSAQGADFDLGLSGGSELDDPWDRAYLVHPDGLRGTIAAPIEWLIDAAA